jgi:hypothetical protein
VHPSVCVTLHLFSHHAVLTPHCSHATLFSRHAVLTLLYPHANLFITHHATLFSRHALFFSPELVLASGEFDESASEVILWVKAPFMAG